MKVYLLPQEGQFYKANLHCHSDYSDGRLSPAEMKAAYQEKGFSVVAFTDHDILIAHQELTDETFLALNGYEMEITEHTEGDLCHGRCCHICLIALEPDNLKQVCWNGAEYLFANALKHMDEVQFYEDDAHYERVYSPECLNDMMKRGRDHGFFVTYNHPTWSGEGYPEYMQYKYMHAMEMWNAGNIYAGWNDYNPRVYEDMLRGGKRLYCVGSDDCHSMAALGDAWTMIKAEKLEYRTITKAMEAGSFYASTGPEIRDLWVEDGVIHVECSKASKIMFSYSDRRVQITRANPDSFVEEASAKIYPLADYVRVTIEDAEGKRAESNAYFLDELRKSGAL